HFLRVLAGQVHLDHRPRRLFGEFAYPAARGRLRFPAVAGPDEPAAPVGVVPDPGAVRVGERDAVPVVGEREGVGDEPERLLCWGREGEDVRPVDDAGWRPRGRPCWWWCLDGASEGGGADSGVGVVGLGWLPVSVAAQGAGCLGVVPAVVEGCVSGEFRDRFVGREFGGAAEYVEAVAVVGVAGRGADARILSWAGPVG